MSAPAYICGKELVQLHRLVRTARSAVSTGKLRKAKETIDQALAITGSAIEQADAPQERAA